MGSHPAPPAPSRTALSPFATLDPAVLAALPATTPITVRSAALSAPHLLYLGTGGGKLLLFSLQTPSSPEFLRLVPTGANRPVSAILPLPSVSRVLLLADGTLLLADPLLARPVRRLGSLRNVAAVAASSPSASSCSLAVAVGKKLLAIDLTLREADELEVQTREIAAGAGVEGISVLTWVGQDSVFAGAASGYSLFSTGGMGQSVDIFALPESAGSPRIRPLSGGEEVMLLVDNVGVVVDRFGHPSGSSFVFNSRPDCIAEVFPYVVVAGESKLDVYRRRNGAHLQTVTIESSRAGVLTVASDDKVVVIATAYKVFCYIKVSAVEQIKAPLRRKSYREAISLLEEFESDGEISKDMISFVHAQLGFLLFFDLHFEDAVNHFLLSETMQPAEIFPFIMRDPNRWSNLVPRKRYWGLHPPPKPLEEVIDDGLVTLQRALFLKKAGVDTVVDEGFLSNPPSRADLLELAIRNIIRYLCVAREKTLSPAEMEGVDTLLMYLYRALDLVDDMERLASSQNSCVVEELESLLENSGHQRTLAFLYGSKGMCSQAVAIWRILARNYSTGLWKDRPNLPETDSHEALAEKRSGEQIAAIEASKILQATSDQDLVLEHLGWVADIDQDLATAILTSEMREKQLSAEKVIAALDSGKVGIHQRYLQWLIEDQGCDDPHYHTSYALLLSKSAMQAFHVESNSREKDDREIESDVQFIFSLRERLQLFLQSSDLYDPEEVLDVIEESELWLEKAILYRKMGQENIVLQILALKLEDSEAAEQYCAEIGRDDAYIQLLDLYLDPKNGREPMFTAAVRLLHNHGKSLDPIQVLERLSSDMPLQLASDTILRMLRARVHHHRQGQIVHSLSLATNLDARLTRLEERSRHVQLTDESICDSCRARLGTKLFVMYPDDSVVCYRCYRNQGDSVSRRGRNFRKDAIFKQSWLVSR